MPNVGVTIFDTPKPTALFFSAPGSQKLAITAAHQCEAGLHQTNGSIAQIVRFPGSVWDAFLAEQCLCDGAICAAVALCIERANSFTQPLAPLL